MALSRNSLHHHSPLEQRQWTSHACVTFRHPHPVSPIKAHISSRVKSQKSMQRGRSGHSLPIHFPNQTTTQKETEYFQPQHMLGTESRTDGVRRPAAAAHLRTGTYPRQSTANERQTLTRGNLAEIFTQHVGVGTDPCPLDLAHDGRSTSLGCEQPPTSGHQAAPVHGRG